jgi:hypothetical protein
MYYPNNSKSSFRTQLAQELSLKEEHEVALVEINYSSNIKTQLGSVIIHNYYNEIFSSYTGSLEIPISINNNIEITELLTNINTTINKALIFDLYSYLHTLTHIPINRDLLIDYSDLYLFNKEQNNFAIEVYKTLEVDSKFIYIDIERSAYKEEFLKVNPKLKYNSNFRRWEFNYSDIKSLSRKFNIRIILVKYDIKNFKNTVNKLGNQHEFLQLDQLLEINQIRYNDKDFDLNRDLGINLNEIDKFIYLDYKNEQLVNFKLFETPLFNLVNDINKNKSAVKISYSNECVDCITLTDKLSVLFTEKNKSTLTKEKIYIIDSHIQAINYALIYTDIIRDQYFGDSFINILKMIPLKSSNDNEVVTFFDNLHYVPLCKNKFTSINIEIRDIYGELIQFDDLFTYVILKLHFRKL